MARTKMTRPQKTEITRALINLVGTVDISSRQNESSLLPVGWGEAPDKTFPYMVVSSLSGPLGEGPLDDTQADVEDHYQLTALSDTAEGAELILDAARAKVTPAALQEQLDLLPSTDATARRILRVEVELSSSAFRADRGMPDPIFHCLDQILVHSTPA